MIPKVIHYCWFGRGEKPKLALQCIESWKKFLPDYEIKEWNEDNYDVHKIPYTSQAYQAKKYAFVSDYARFDILYHHGGLYFDTDVEIVKSLSDILVQGAFMGFETDSVFEGDGQGRTVGTINPGLGLAVCPNEEVYKAILDLYKTLSFVNEDGTYDLTTVVTHVTNLFVSRGLRAAPGVIDFQGIRLYPKEFFNPKDSNGNITITPNTYTVHHFAASWYTPKQKIVHWVICHLGVWPGRLVGLLLRNPLGIPKRIYDFLKGKH